MLLFSLVQMSDFAPEFVTVPAGRYSCPMSSNATDHPGAVPPASSTRDRILDAFEGLLGAEGEKSATLSAVASAAGVSKGGLLYHFASKDALVEAQLARLADEAATDTENIRTAPAGPIDYLIRTSVNTGSPLDRSFIATARLAQGRHESAIAVLETIRGNWLAVVEESVGDPDVARAILLVSDGLYANSSLAAAAPKDTAMAAESEGMDRLLAVLARLSPRD